MEFVDAFYEGPINYYVNTHEQNTGHAATGYAKSTGKTGVCVVTSGPGLTNIVTPMLDATNDSTPLVVFSGQVPLSAMNTNAFQECSAVDISKPVTKWSYCVKNVEELPLVIDAAFEIANNGKKGAVHIDLPKCILAKKYKGVENWSSEIYTKKHLIENKYISQGMENIEKIACIINNSKKPVLYIGQGCNNEQKLLTELAIKANIPVTTTIHAMGIFDEDNKLSLEFLGMHGNVAANYAVQASDCIIAIGSRFDDRTTGNIEKYAPVAKKASQLNTGGIIHVNISPNQINNVVKSDYNVVSDAGIFMKELMPFIKYKERTSWSNKFTEWKKKHPFQI